VTSRQAIRANFNIEKHNPTMVLHRLSIQRLLLLTTIGVTAIMGIILLTAKASINRSTGNYTTLSRIDQLEECALRLRKNEKDFLEVDTKNPHFFATGQSRYVSDYDSLLSVTKKIIGELKDNDAFASDERQQDVVAMERGLSGYNRSFKELVALVQSVGFKDEGVVGSMRNAIHEVEGELSKASSPSLMVDMLMLRRHEKDYMLRHDTTYVSKFDGQMASMLKKVKSPAMASLLGSYKKYFEEYVAMSEKMGIGENRGISASMSINASRFEQALEHARSQIREHERRSSNRSLFVLFAVIILLSVLVATILSLTSTHILKSIKKLQGYLSQLGKGELPETIKVESSDEIAEMELSINKLVGALSNTRDFAVAVGNGNFEAKISVFDNSGEVGESLLEMRKKLSQVAQERQRQEEESRTRLWINEGIALVNDVVNKGKDDIEELCYEFILGIARYSGVNMAGILLEERDGDGVSFLTMVATYALDRRKYNKKRVEIGEGLAGMCFFEKEKIYITDVPASYSPICSALGEASPRCVVVIPLIVDSKAIGVMELASFKVFEAVELELFERAAGILAARLLGLRTSLSTSRLLEQTKKQAQEMAAQEEELRQNLEELHATQEAFEHREAQLYQQMEQKEKEIAQVKHDADGERAGFLERLAVHKQAIDAFGTAFLLAEFDLKGNLEWANGKFCQTFAVDLDFVESFNILLCDAIANREKELQKWEDLRKKVAYVGPLDLLAGNRVVKLTASYQVVMGMKVKGERVFFSAAVIGEQLMDGELPNHKMGEVALETVEN
jgi:hypothetical protein